MIAVEWLALALAAIPAALFLRNLSLYRPPPPAGRIAPPVSVLIPARNEEGSIGRAIEAVLQCSAVEFELLVLDDNSEDRTAEIVQRHAGNDARVRLLSAPPLPPGWCGKTRACQLLAEEARHPLLIFVDADVRLTPDALPRCAAFMEETGCDLASGVPRQETVGLLEKLLIPQIHFVLLGFLPISRMRRSADPAYGAGCGQLFVALRSAYFQAGGHASIRTSAHDGIQLPRAFRRAGLRTDLFDATGIASCRMYASAAEVWRGLGKNASEGLASPRLIGPMTAMLFGGQILPWILLMRSPLSSLLWLAAASSLLPAILAIRRFAHPWEAVAIRPVAILLLLVIQWQAFLRARAGRPSTWRGRTIDASA